MSGIIKILVVDDDEEDYIITRDVIQDIPNRKYSIDWVDNYEEGLEKISWGEHDVYLVDYRLGKHNGLEIIEHAVKHGCKSPLILLTGQQDVEIDEQAMKAGASDYLYKGTINPSQLERSIRYCMEHARNLEEIRNLNANLEQRVEERTYELAQAIKELEYANKTLQKQIQERKLVEEALRNSQKLYSIIAHNFPNGTINVYDREMRCVFVDGQELAKLKLTSEMLLGKTVQEMTSPEVAKTMIANFKEVFEGKNGSFEIVRSGSQYILDAVPLVNSKGEIPQILVVAQNITEQKKAEEKIIKALEKERDLNELKSRFVAMASHEFRTPLSTILSSISLIGKYIKEEDQEKRLKHINRIKFAVNNLTGILNDFLSYSKLEEGKVNLNPIETEISNLMKDIVGEMEVFAKDNQQIIYEHHGANQVMIDKQFLTNILINLLSNAIKYSSTGKKIWLTTRLEDHQLSAIVKDEGMGIPLQEQIHLFERFFRAKNAINIEGTGLGLNIVKKYIDLLGGTIHFESELEKGTTFTINIPVN